MYPNSESGAAVQVRLSGSELDSLENWRRAQEKIPPRSEALREAIRRLVFEQDEVKGVAAHQRQGRQGLPKKNDWAAKSAIGLRDRLRRAAWRRFWLGTLLSPLVFTSVDCGAVLSVASFRGSISASVATVASTSSLGRGC